MTAERKFGVVIAFIVSAALLYPGDPCLALMMLALILLALVWLAWEESDRQ